MAAVIRAATHVYEFPMVDRDPLAREIAAHGPGAVAVAVAVAVALEAYEAERNPATARIVLANRGNGPEQVMQLVQSRAPDGFKSIHDVLSDAELEGAAANYKRLAGFDKDALNARPPLIDRTVPPPLVTR